MKIHECEKQLKKLIKNYECLEERNKDILNILERMDRNNITIKNVYEILDIIDSMRKYIPLNILKEVESCFDDFDITAVYTIQDRIMDIHDLFNNNGISFNCRYTNEIKDSNMIISEKNHFNKIYRLYKFLDKYIYPKLFNPENADIDEVFKACMDAKNIIWEYALSLEVPTEPDYV